MILFGISNCDTVRKARKWLSERDVEFTFHDFRKDGLERDAVQTWLDQVGSEILLNKRGTTWRQLPEDAKSDLSDDQIVDLLIEHPTLIKRPVLVSDEQVLVGFKEAEYLKLT